MSNLYMRLAQLEVLFEFIRDKFWAYFIKKGMGKCGKNIMIKPTTSVFKGIENFYFEGDLRIARYAVIYSTKAKVIIGKKVGIAPYLKIITGNHSTDGLGHFMFDGNYDKKPEDDQDVIIEGDSWLGINVTILAGVTVGRGTAISAGAVVTKSCPPYSILVGVPARVLRYRFTIDEILKHEQTLYSKEERFTKEELIKQRNQINAKNIN